MPTLAEAAVEITADTEGFEAELRQGIEKASSTAQRASEGIGTRIGQTITSGAQRALGGLGRAVQRPLDALGGQFTRLNRSITRALDATPATRNLRAGLAGITTDAAGISGALNRVGTTANAAFGAARSAVSGLSQGIRTVGGAVANVAGAGFARLSSAVQGIGGVASGAFGAMRSGLSSISQGLTQSQSSASLLNSSLSKMAGLGAGLAAAVGVGQLGAEIGQVASSAQTTEASLTALYEASGSGAAEVNALMDDMSDRFRGLDMSVMNEGATTLAYMGLEGTEAVDVLERLEGATTAAGTGATGMTRALDAMTKGVNNGKFQMGELSQISNAGIPIYDALADVLGVDIPEAQAMASAGAVDLEDVLEALSGEAGTWFPALLEGAEGVSQTFSGSWDTIRNTFVNGIANELVPVLDGLAPVMQKVASGMENAFDRLPGAVEAVTDAAVDSGAWETFQEVLSGIGEVAQSLQPAFSGFASGVSIVGGYMLDLLGHLQPVGSALGTMADYLSDNEETVRAVGSALGGMVTVLAVWRSAALAASLASYALNLGIRGIGVAIRGIPLVGWVLAAVGALIALYQTSDRFREIVDTAFTRVRDAVLAAWTVIEPVWSAMASGLSDLWDSISGWSGWETAWDAISAAVELNWEIISGVWEALTGAWDSLTSSTSDTSWWTDTWDTITGALEGAWNVIQPILDTFQGAMGLLSGLVVGDAGLSEVGDFAQDAFSNFQDVGKMLAEGIIAGLKALPRMILSALGTVGGVIIDFFRDLPSRVASMLATAAEWVSWLKDLPGRVLPHLVKFGQTLMSYFMALPAWIAERIDVAALISWLTELPGRILDAMVEYGPTLLRGFALAFMVVAAGIPALLLGLLAVILVVLGTIAVEIAQWAWGAFSNMMTVAGQAVLAGINSVVAWFAELPSRILGAVADFGERLAAWGLSAINSLRAVLVAGMAAVRSWWSGIWSGIFTTARTLWDNFVAWGAGAAVRLREAIMTPINSLRTRMVAAFEAAQSGIKSAWNKVKSVVGKPIEWVVNTAYNNWLRGVWGKVVDKFGGPSLPEMTVAFARGGTMPGGGGGSSSGVFPGYTPGRDVHAMPMAAFSGGESVLRPEITRAWGAKTTLMLNKLARTGGVGAVRKALGMLFSGQNPFTGRSVPKTTGGGGAGFAQQFSLGGILGSVGGSAANAAAWIGGKTSDFAEGMMDFLDDPGGTLQKIFDQIMDYSKMPSWGTGWTDVLKNLPKKIIEKLVEKAKSLFSIDGDGDWADLGGNVGGRLGAALAFAKSQTGKPYVWGGVGPAGYDCCLVGSTLVQCPDGRVRIDQLRAGDMVSSHEEGRVTERMVTAQWFSRRQKVYTVRTRVGEVTGSDNHPFLVLDSDGGTTWKRLDELAPGMELLTPDGGRFATTVIESITTRGEQDTYDIEVEGSHNFVADGVVVHNSGFMSAIHNVIVGKRPYSRRYTTHGFSGSSAHGFRRNMPSPFTIGNTHASVGHQAGTLLGTNVESRGSAGVVVGPRARGTKNALFTSRWGLMAAARAAGSGGRMGGEGIAFDSGGLLPRGHTLTYNGTRSPETVRTAAQEANVERLVRMVGAQFGPRGSGSGLVPAGREREFARAVGGELGGAGTTVNAPVTVNTYAADPETVAYKTAARISRLAGI